MKNLFAVFPLLFFFCFVAASKDYYVSNAGNDSASGSESQPWKTIQHACDSVSPGDTIYVRGGIYPEQIAVVKSGSSTNACITIRNYESETPVIDGSSLEPAENWSALIKIENQSYVTVQGFEIRNFASSNQSSVPIGILICGRGTGVSLLDNIIHHIEHKNVSSKDGNAHGIAVYGTDGINSINNLVISGNTVRDCKLGWSESLVLNGNVENFIVSKNTVHDNDNIGMDFIGWEKTAPSNDQARNGIVAENKVYNISSSANPAYNGERSAAGIYVDGGKDIVIERNCVYNCDMGVEVASENPGKTTSGITVRNNLFYFNGVTGLAFGGYDTKLGVTVDCAFTHNTFYKNDTTNSGTGEIMIQIAHSNAISNNVIFASKQNIIITNYFTKTYSYDNSFDYNLYYCPGGFDKACFVWQNKEYTGFTAFKQASGQDASSIFDNPLFVDGAAEPPNLDIAANSPAINAGSPDFVPAPGETDYAGNPRVAGGRTDCGAYEAQQSGESAELTMAVSPEISGKTVPSIGKHSIPVNSPISITATPEKGYVFSSWTSSENAEVSNPQQPITTVVIVGDAVVTANFAIVPSATSLCIGSTIEINAEEIFSGKQFIKKPRVFGTIDGTDCQMPVAEKPKKSLPLDNITAEWKRKFLIYDRFIYNKKVLLSELLKSPIPDKPIKKIVVDYAGEEKKLDQNYALVSPVVDSISGNFSNSDDVFTLSGRYFGGRLPTVYIEYLKNGEKNSPGYKKCRLDKEKSLKYQNAQHRPASSCMVVHSDDPFAEGKEVGYSEISVIYPKLKESEIPTGILILDSGISLASFAIPQM